MAIAPIDAVASFSNIGVHLIPPEVDFHKPPEAVPENMISGFEWTTSIDVTRPDIPPGPMFLGVLFLSNSIEKVITQITKAIIKSERIFFIVLSFTIVLSYG